jgi:hypothetical protein
MASHTDQQSGGWYSDPTDRYIYRYWDGTQWTEQVSGGGASTTADDVPLDATVVRVPPLPGTEAQSPAQPPAQPAVVVTQKSGSTFIAAIGVILAIIAIIVIVVMLTNQSADDPDSNPGTTSVTEAPATTTP